MHGKKETNKSNIAEKGFEQKKKRKKTFYTELPYIFMKNKMKMYNY